MHDAETADLFHNDHNSDAKPFEEKKHTEISIHKLPAGPETVRAGIAILWRCGLVHFFIMHIMVFSGIYSGELKIHCFFQ